MQCNYIVERCREEAIQVINFSFDLRCIKKSDINETHETFLNNQFCLATQNTCVLNERQNSSFLFQCCNKNRIRG